MAAATGSPTGADPSPPAQPGRWRREHWLLLGAVVVVGILLRVTLLPTAGLTGDLDQFVGWVHGIAIDGLGDLYGENPAGPVTFGPVMAYIWALLAALDPAFQTAIDSSDPAVRTVMKLPASIADVGLALVAAYALRERPGWAVVAAAAILLHPAVIDVSAWWGQYESIYLLSALGAVVAAVHGRNGVAAALIAVSLMTKPQAIPFLIPFAAWFWATGYARDGVRGGVRELARTAVIGLAVIVVLWLPFIPAGGPAGYLRNLGEYQSEIFRMLSLRAWNLWWILQDLVAPPGRFVLDDFALLGPVTPRQLGYVLTGLTELLIAAAIVRDPRPRTLILGLAASVLAFFTFMTQMHERYAYGAVIFLVLLIADRRIGILWLALSVVFTLNLLAAVPPTPEIGALLPVDGPLGLAGSLAMLVLTVTLIVAMRRPRRDASPGPSGYDTGANASLSSAGG